MDFDIEHLVDDMPIFKNHEEAQNWFKDRYHDRFVRMTTNDEEGKMVYFYHLVKDPDAYQSYIASLEDPDTDITTTEPFYSYSTIEINEDGEISVTL
ncbi:hypothetical protein [Mesobacillus harenae]|uniref:hypothetical protein n=1 Tax=Mesobacillus harenae TaxID=2213203 RepID=UPI001580F1C4|nr:hypothetical protein [Mesobacillus harenae]